MRKITKEEWLEILFYSFILCIWVIWAYILPFNEGPDEYMRSRIVDYIVEYKKLPTGFQPEIMDYTWGFTYGFRPILPQMLEAVFVLAARLFTTNAFTLLFAGRMASVLCGAVFAAYVRRISKELFRGADWQWLFTLLAVCMPQCSFLFTYLNCDSMALMAAAMIFYYWIQGSRDSWKVSTCVLLAFSLSLCILSYYNAYGFLVSSVLIFTGWHLEKGRKEKEARRDFWKKGCLIAGIVLLLSGWWFARNYVLYDGDFLGLRTQNLYAEEYALEFLKPSNRQTYENQGLSPVYMLFHSDWVSSVYKSFVGMLGPLWYPLRWWMYVGYGLLFAGGIFGAVLGGTDKLKRRSGKKPDFARLFWHLGLLTAILIPNILNFWYSYGTDYQPQGRYSMPMLLPFLYYIVGGWKVILKKLPWETLKKTGLRLVCVWIAAVLLLCLTEIMWPAYRDVEDKSVVRTYTMEELYGKDWEEKMP